MVFHFRLSSWLVQVQKFNAMGMVPIPEREGILGKHDS